ncbi:MAG: hypothetical protein CML29_01705 [Rhizobiales bacterium]|nr:hypothetical protein [Hyphomicrobiales bacterium]MBA68038.1 hypothetical protein [Hyphomicrobiales bacterium]|tara:strand:- start:239 stop:709 length:471 start_codon:yes stop_codon:yes gene_type:complete
MWFLIKTTFWGMLALAALPFFVKANIEPSAEPQQEQAQIGVTESLGAAFSALDDIRRICSRQPDVCTKGGEALHALGLRARDGALIAYRLIDDKLSDEEKDALAPVAAELARAGIDEQDVADIITGSLPDHTVSRITKADFTVPDPATVPVPTFIR